MSDFCLVTHAKFCLFWHYQSTVSEMGALYCYAVFLLTLFYLNKTVFTQYVEFLVCLSFE